MNTVEYLNKLYSGFLGMNAGIRLGAPVEPTLWTYERIKKTYGEITGYVKEFKNFAADDDANGPYYFLRAIYDDAGTETLKPQDVARAWLNYAREGIGMFWWGGYGISTEHTAYLNLKNGIEAPRSGSIEMNGKIMAEQIGGQIFIDTWGLVNPNNPKKAAEYGRAAASVSHDGEGVYGAEFFCAAISKAFSCSDIREIIECGLSHIPQDSLYCKVSREVIEFYEKNPDDFRACYQMLVEKWGYDKYKGACHIIPNAGVCILSMMYGKGDFNRTIEIATMCGWDTDCNAGNVATVLGVMCGIDGIKSEYLKPINDSIVLSGISGYLNILDIPSYVKELAIIGYKLMGETVPQDLLDSFKEDEIYFDFELPGSTHNIRVSDPFMCRVVNSNDKAFKGNGSLEILYDRMSRGENCRIFYKPFYTRDDFSDERYSPVFSGKAFSGQTVSFQVYLDQWSGNEPIGISPYVRLAKSKKILNLGFVQPKYDEWSKIEFTIPDSEGEVIDEVGFILEGYSPAKAKSLGRLFMDEFRIYGKADYKIDFSKQMSNFGNITPFASNHGAWSIEGDKLNSMRVGECESYSGNYYAKDYKVSVNLTPINGDTHFIAVRAQGAMRGYHLGFDGENNISIYINDFGFKKIANAEFKWEIGKEYEFSVSAVGGKIELFIDGKNVISCSDSKFKYGMFGFSSISMGRTSFGNVHFISL